MSWTCAVEIALGVDTDQDGIPDQCEWDHFGNLSHGPDEDADYDGVTNQQECLDGTDPNDPYLMISVEAEFIRLDWLTAPRKTRVLEQAEDLSDGQAWTETGSVMPPYFVSPTNAVMWYRLLDR